MIYADHDPEPRLEPWVASYWSLRVEPAPAEARHLVPPDGCVNLAFRDGLAVLVGPRVEAFAPPVVPGASWFGVRFKPGAARAFLGLSPAIPLRNSNLLVETLPGLEWAAALGRRLASSEGSGERPRLADEHLLIRLDRARTPDARIRQAVGLLLTADEQPSVRQLAELAGLSERHFRRRFSEEVDLSPKELARVWRLRRCALDAHLTPSTSWAARAADHGFADQSHLVNEFRRLVGLPPEEFARRIAHFEHRRLWVPSRDHGDSGG